MGIAADREYTEYANNLTINGGLPILDCDKKFYFINIIWT